MKRMDLDYVVITILLLSGLYVAITGLLMDIFGSPQFFWHSYAGYASAALAGLHLALNWERITAYLRWRFKSHPSRTSPAPREPKPSLNRRGFLTAALAAAGGLALGWLLPSRQTVTLPDETIDVGQFYHRWSKLGVTLTPGTLLSWGKQPMRYKTYPKAKQIALPDPHGYRGLSLEEAIERRRSRREYTTEPLSLTELSCLLHAAGGITAPAQEFRAAPSAGALYPIEIYGVVQYVAGLEAGLYHYAVADHALEQLRTGNLRPALVVAGLGQEMLAQAPLCFVLSAVFQRARWKYHERAYRYILLETGHIGQNLYLTATSLGLGACAAGAFLDDELNDLLGLDGEAESALYLVAVGGTYGPGHRV